MLLLDTNFTNNSFTTEPQGARAATKWALKWMVWLQDQLVDLGILRVMTSAQALLDGIRRVNRAPVVLACVFGVTLLAALPFSVFMRDALQQHLGNSLAAEAAARGVNYQWWTEFTGQAGGLGRTFTTTIIGFAAVLDNLSTLLDGESRPSSILWLGAGYLLLWLFLSGGILDRYARARPTRSYEFFTACGVYFVRFLRLAPIIALTPPSSPGVASSPRASSSPRRPRTMDERCRST